MIISKTYWHDRGYEYTNGWHTYYKEQLLNFLNNYELLPGTIIEYGSYQGKMLDYLSKRYPHHEVVGIDIYNINKHSNIIETDIKDFNSTYKLSLALNELIDYSRDLDSKMAGRSHALKNLISGGFYVDSSRNPVKYIEGLDLLYSVKYMSFFIKNT